MASSGGSLNTSVNHQHHHTSSFSSSQYMSSNLTDLRAAGSNREGGEDLNNQQRSFNGWAGGTTMKNNSSSNQEKSIEIPKYKSFSPASLPLSPPPISPSSYLSFPPSLSPSVFLDSPLAFSSNNVLPSPTTGSFAALDSKEEEKKFSDFSFQSQTRPYSNSLSSLAMFSSSAGTNSTDPFTGQQESELKSEQAPVHSFSRETSTIQTNMTNNSAPQVSYAQPSQYVREQRKSDDGYNWRKYGQKQVKGSENPRSYYKCTFSNCPTKKKVEQNLDGHITEIVYKGSHNHPKPQSTRRSSSNSIHNPSYNNLGMSTQSNSFLENAHMDPVGTPENSSASFGDDDIEQGSSMSNSRDDENEPEAKRWRGENENEGISASGSRTVREPRIVVQTTSDIDILDDGYRWRKYGQKVVKGNPNPRSYYKCTSNGCPVRKHVERACHDTRAVITTYEGKHNHDVPAARGSGSYAMSRTPAPTTTIRPSAINSHSNGTNFQNPNRLQPMQNQTPYTLHMVQDKDNFEFSSFGNSYFSQMQLAAKEEPKDDSFFDSFLS